MIWCTTRPARIRILTRIVDAVSRGNYGGDVQAWTSTVTLLVGVGWLPSTRLKSVPVCWVDCFSSRVAPSDGALLQGLPHQIPRRHSIADVHKTTACTSVPTHRHDSVSLPWAIMTIRGPPHLHKDVDSMFVLSDLAFAGVNVLGEQRSKSKRPMLLRKLEASAERVRVAQPVTTVAARDVEAGCSRRARSPTPASSRAAVAADLQICRSRTTASMGIEMTSVSGRIGHTSPSIGRGGLGDERVDGLVSQPKNADARFPLVMVHSELKASSEEDAGSLLCCFRCGLYLAVVPTTPSFPPSSSASLS